MQSPEEQLVELTRGVVDVIQLEELRGRLGEGRPLRIKAGFDPTRPDLHIGHTVLMQKMRQFQDLGHEVTFLIGDFTAMVGDPTGQNDLRPRLTRAEVLSAAKTYQDQAFKVLDPHKTRVRFNSEWLSRLTLEHVIELLAKRTVARTLERRDFRERFDAEKDIHLHELAYPMLQAYDSVELQCDVELGGTDQLFNLMVGRDLMQRYGVRPQIVMTTPILEGIDARIENGAIVGKKMSKSADNYVGISEEPVEMYRKCMQIGDDVVWRFYQLLSSRTQNEIDTLRSVGDPLAAKAGFAREMVTRFHGGPAADSAETAFRSTYLGDGVPDDVPELELPAKDGKLMLAKALTAAGLTQSNSAGFSLILNGGVEVDGEIARDKFTQLDAGKEYLVRVGSKKRRFCRIRVIP